MSLEIVKFKRPYSIAISSRGVIATLIRPTITKLVVISNNRNKSLSIDLKAIGLKGAHSLVFNWKDELIILDNINRKLFCFNEDFKLLASLDLPGKKYGTMKYNKDKNLLYISIKDKSIVITIPGDNFEKYSELFSYSDINSISSIDGLTFFKKDKLIIIDKELSCLFIMSSNKKEISIEKFLEFGRNGFGKIRRPTDVNVVGELIAVHDNDNYLIQFFDYKMKFISQTGGKGSDIGCFDLAVSGFANKNDLFVCDQNNDRIIKLDVFNEFNYEVIAKDKFVKGFLSRPSGISFHKNLLFIADRSNGVIQVFDHNCKYLFVLNIKDEILNRPSSISIVEKERQSIAAIIERRDGSNCKLNFYLLGADFKSAEYLNTIDSKLIMNDPQDMDSSISSNFYVADTLNRRIIKIDIDGKLVNEVDMVKITQNKRILVKTVSVRDDGDVFTADFDKCIVYHFDSNLRFQNKIDFSPYKEDIKVIRSICAFEKSLIMCVRGDNQILKAQYNGIILSPIVSNNVDWSNPVKICKSNNETIYISDKENDRIVKFNN